MKHLLLILCVVVFVSPVLAAEKCQVIDENINAEYSGECKNGMAEGEGTARGRDAYEGGFVKGLKHGKGTYTWSNGDKYVGEWQNDWRHGQGTMTWASDSKYVGEWKSGKPNGQGTKTWAKGGRYVGEFREGRMIGQGQGVAQSADDILGKWSSEDMEGVQIEFYRCGAAYCAKIVRLRHPDYPVGSTTSVPGTPRLDDKNEVETLRNRPLLGLEIIRALVPGDKDEWVNGRAYNFINGKDYRASALMVATDRLELQASIFIFYRTIRWTREGVRDAH